VEVKEITEGAVLEEVVLEVMALVEEITILEVLVTLEVLINPSRGTLHLPHKEVEEGVGLREGVVKIVARNEVRRKHVHLMMRLRPANISQG
jgi:hypothetical protein